MLRQFAHIISALFLPPFFPTIGLIYLMLANPYRYSFGGPDDRKLFLVIIVFIMTAIFPIIVIMIMRAQKMISSLSLSDRKERTIPYIASASFYIWATLIFIKGRDDIYGADETLIYLLSGATLSTFIAFVMNIFLKVSIHTMAAGSMIGLIVFSANYAIYKITPFLFIAILLGGLIGMSRLVLKAHRQEEIYWGYALGFIGQFLGFYMIPHLIPYIS